MVLKSPSFITAKAVHNALKDERVNDIRKFVSYTAIMKFVS